MGTNQSILRRIDAVVVPFPLIVRLFLGAFFIYTGVTKAQAPVHFLKAVRLYDMLPESPAIFLNSTAIVLPWLEIVCGIALIVGIYMRGAAVIMALMLCVFTPSIFLRSLVVMREESISFFKVAFDCGCGTGAEIIWVKLLKNLGLLLLAVTLTLSNYRRFTMERLLSSRRPTTPEPG